MEWSKKRGEAAWRLPDGLSFTASARRRHRGRVVAGQVRPRTMLGHGPGLVRSRCRMSLVTSLLLSQRGSWHIARLVSLLHRPPERLSHFCTVRRSACLTSAPSAGALVSLLHRPSERLSHFCAVRRSACLTSAPSAGALVSLLHRPSERLSHFCTVRRSACLTSAPSVGAFARLESVTSQSAVSRGSRRFAAHTTCIQHFLVYRAKP